MVIMGDENIFNYSLSSQTLKLHLFRQTWEESNTGFTLQYNFFLLLFLHIPFIFKFSCQFWKKISWKKYFQFLEKNIFLLVFIEIPVYITVFKAKTILFVWVCLSGLYNTLKTFKPCSWYLNVAKIYDAVYFYQHFLF